MYAVEVKQFIIDENMRRTMTLGQKLNNNGGSLDLTHVPSYLASSIPKGTRYNLNDTMPLGNTNLLLPEDAK
jgi:hypothetical protein